MIGVLGYVVIEYNQASSHPALVVGAELYGDEQEARDELDGFVADAASIGRRERYPLAQVVLLGEED